MKYSDERNEIFKSYVKAWAKIKTLNAVQIAKIETKKGNGYQYKYADLADHYDQIKDILSDVGIGVAHDSRTARQEDGKYRNEVNTILIHESGQFMESDYLSYDEVMETKLLQGTHPITSPDMKGNGGQLTYMRRFSLSATLSLSSGDRPDAGNGPQETAEEYTNRKKSEFLGDTPRIPPAMIEEPQKLEMQRLWEQIGKTQKVNGMEVPPEKVWEQVLLTYPVLKDAKDIENLTRDSAIKVLNLLRKYKSGELELFPQ